MMKYQWANKIALFVLILAFMLIGYISYMLFYPFKPIEFLPGHFTTCKQTYQRGEIMCYRMHYNKYMKVRGEAICYFVDGIMFQMPDMMTNNPTGLQDFVKMAFAIPKELPPGHYKLHMTITYKINPLREIEKTIESNYFDIVK